LITTTIGEHFGLNPAGEAVVLDRSENDRVIFHSGSRFPQIVDLKARRTDMFYHTSITNVSIASIVSLSAFTI
jgi:hypothetical protein